MGGQGRGREDRWLYLVQARAKGRWRAMESEGSRRASKKLRMSVPGPRKGEG
jgi:hypothetical protein